jgi:hypothetical protein
MIEDGCRPVAADGDRQLAGRLFFIRLRSHKVNHAVSEADENRRVALRNRTRK